MKMDKKIWMILALSAVNTQNSNATDSNATELQTVPLGKEQQKASNINASALKRMKIKEAAAKAEALKKQQEEEEAAQKQQEEAAQKQQKASNINAFALKRIKIKEAAEKAEALKKQQEEEAAAKAREKVEAAAREKEEAAAREKAAAAAREKEEAAAQKQKEDEARVAAAAEEEITADVETLLANVTTYDETRKNQLEETKNRTTKLVENLNAATQAVQEKTQQLNTDTYQGTDWAIWSGKPENRAAAAVGIIELTKLVEKATDNIEAVQSQINEINIKKTEYSEKLANRHAKESEIRAKLSAGWFGYKQESAESRKITASNTNLTADIKTLNNLQQQCEKAINDAQAANTAANTQIEATKTAIAAWSPQQQVRSTLDDLD